MEAILLKVKHVKLRIRLRMRMRMKKIQKIQRTRLHKLTQHSANRTARTEGVQDVSICFGTSDITDIHWHLIIQASSEHHPSIYINFGHQDLSVMFGCSIWNWWMVVAPRLSITESLLNVVAYSNFSEDLSDAKGLKGPTLKAQQAEWLAWDLELSLRVLGSSWHHMFLIVLSQTVSCNRQIWLQHSAIIA